MKIKNNCLAMDFLLHNLIIQIDISSWPCTLLMLRALIIFSISALLKQINKSLAAEAYLRQFKGITYNTAVSKGTTF